MPMVAWYMLSKESYMNRVIRDVLPTVVARVVSRGFWRVGSPGVREGGGRREHAGEERVRTALFAEEDQSGGRSGQHGASPVRSLRRTHLNFLSGLL